MLLSKQGTSVRRDGRSLSESANKHNIRFQCNLARWMQVCRCNDKRHSSRRCRIGPSVTQGHFRCRSPGLIPRVPMIENPMVKTRSRDTQPSRPNSSMAFVSQIPTVVALQCYGILVGAKTLSVLMDTWKVGILSRLSPKFHIGA